MLESCTISPDVDLTLSDAAAKRLLQTVVLSCLRADTTGALTPADADAAGVADSIARLRTLGYRVEIGIHFADSTGTAPPPDQAAAELANAAFRTTLVAAAQGYDADGWWLAPPTIAASGQSDLTALVTALSGLRSPQKTLSLLLPPSTDGDLVGGDAFDLPSLAPLVDRMDVATLDYSCCGSGPGPTLDAGWAAEAVHYAAARAPGVPLTASVPLYGVDFSPTDSAYVCYDDAERTLTHEHASLERTAAGTPHFAYTASGVAHEVWFDDAVSLGLALAAWEPPALGADVGVTWYSLGCEDPNVWPRVAGAIR